MEGAGSRATRCTASAFEFSGEGTRCTPAPHMRESRCRPWPTRAFSTRWARLSCPPASASPTPASSSPAGSRSSPERISVPMCKPIPRHLRAPRRAIRLHRLAVGPPPHTLHRSPRNPVPSHSLSQKETARLSLITVCIWKTPSPQALLPLWPTCLPMEVKSEPHRRPRTLPRRPKTPSLYSLVRKASLWELRSPPSLRKGFLSQLRSPLERFSLHHLRQVYRLQQAPLPLASSLKLLLLSSLNSRRSGITQCLMLRPPSNQCGRPRP